MHRTEADLPRARPQSPRAAGTRASRRRKPQQRLSGVVVTSKAPLGLPMHALAVREQFRHVRRDRDGTVTPRGGSRRISRSSRGTRSAPPRAGRSRRARFIAAGTKAPSAAASVISNRQAMARRCTRIQWPHAASRPTTSALRGDSAARNWRRSVRDPWLSPCPCAGEEAMSSLHATQQAAIRGGGPILRPGSRRYSGRVRSGTGEKSRSTGKTRSRPGPPLENRQAVASRGRPADERPCRMPSRPAKRPVRVRRKCAGRAVPRRLPRPSNTAGVLSWAVARRRVAVMRPAAAESQRRARLLSVAHVVEAATDLSFDAE